LILIYPPVAKPGEPPTGIAKLAGVLHAEGLPYTVIDANCEGLLYILHKHTIWNDVWYRRAVRRTETNLYLLRTSTVYKDINRYKQIVKDINHVLRGSTHNQGGMYISLSDYKDHSLSPVCSDDILKAASFPEKNPFYPYFKKRLTSVIETTGDEKIGFSLFYLNQVLTTFAMIGFLKIRFPWVKIIVGGGLVTSWMNNKDWNNPFFGLVDEFIPGPGEKRILSMYGKGNMQDYTPLYSVFPLESYFSPPYILPYTASSGCFYKKCTFCPEKSENNPYIPVSGSTVLHDIRQISEKYKPVLIHFLDNAISISFLKTLIKSPPGIPWYGYTRITENLTDFDFAQKLKKAGCVMLQLGLESGDQGVLDAMKKGFTLSTASKVLKVLKSAGISTYIYLLFGTPWETHHRALKTLEFCAIHHNQIDFINPSIFNMPVCDPENTGHLKTEFYRGDLSLYTDFIHPFGWGRKGVRRFLKHEFQKNRAISAILKATPPYFNANHAPFFKMNQDN